MSYDPSSYPYPQQYNSQANHAGQPGFQDPNKSAYPQNGYPSYNPAPQQYGESNYSPAASQPVNGFHPHPSAYQSPLSQNPPASQSALPPSQPGYYQAQSQAYRGPAAELPPSQPAAQSHGYAPTQDSTAAPQPQPYSQYPPAQPPSYSHPYSQPSSAQPAPPPQSDASYPNYPSHYHEPHPTQPQQTPPPVYNQQQQQPPSHQQPPYSGYAPAPAPAFPNPHAAPNPGDLPAPYSPMGQQGAFSQQQPPTSSVPEGVMSLRSPPRSIGGSAGAGGFAPHERRPQDRIDPKQIPRPISMESKFGAPLVKYYTRSGATPPPSASEFSVVDEGNCSPRFIRLTTNNVAHDSELVDQTKLCVGAIIQPLANLGPDEEPIRMVERPQGPVRCSRCKAYVNPFFRFVDQGAFFICNLCDTRNEVPADYRCNLDANGHRRDRNERPELCRGTVEFVATPEFNLHPVHDPCYLFVIDVSYGAAITGLVSAAVQGIRNALPVLAQNPRTRVGIITYDQTVHFYSIKAGASDPKLLVMSDVNEPFVPCPAEEVLVLPSREEHMTLLEAVLDLLPGIYSQHNVSSDNINAAMGAATQAAAECMFDCGGKLLVFQSGLCSVGAGALKPRDNSALYHTDKEKTLFVPQSPFYTSLGTTCAEKAISVDLFVCANCYIDLATVGVVANKTGGQIFMYPGFNAKKDGEALAKDIYHDVTRATGFDAVMVVRCSSGLKVADYYGNFFHRRAHEMDLPAIDCDKTFGIRLEHDSKLRDTSEACIQVALLYTSATGQRLIRVHTISVPITTAMTNVFRFADLDAIINLSLKQAVRQLMVTATPQDAQKAMTSACVDSLFTYRKYCASATSAGQLILPEPLKLLPLCTLGLIKHAVMQPGLHADERSFLFSYATAMPCNVSMAFICPRLFALHDLPLECCVPDKDGRSFLPAALTLSSSSIRSDGLYLLDDSRFMYLWLGEDLDPELMAQIFVQQPADGQDGAINRLVIASHSDAEAISSRISTMIAMLRKEKPAFQNIQIIKGGARSPGQETLDELAFLSHLIEDSSNSSQHAHPPAKAAVRQPNTMSYIDFLCWIHKQIQSKFVQ